MQRKTPYQSYWHTDLNRLPVEDPSRKEDCPREPDQLDLTQTKIDSFSSASSSFILDLNKLKFTYVSKSVKKITGYSPEDFLSEGFAFCYKIWHPQDTAILQKLHQNLFGYYYSTPITERYRLKFSYNMRIRRKDGSYMHILQQTIFIKIADNGKPLVDFSTLTDITPFKRDHHLTLHIQKINASGEYEQVYKEMFYNYDFAFTRRQLEIITLISKGLTTKEIAARLFLSVDTVKNHRKNILKMTGSKNVVEVYNAMMS